MHDLVATILSRPDAVILSETLQQKLSEEAQRRKQFYEDITPSDKVEFIQGEVIFHSPVKSRHNRATLLIAKLLDTFVSRHQLGYIGMEKLLIALTRNDYEPDVCFFKSEKSKRFSPDQMRFPAPDLVVEVVSESTEARDRGIKYEDYALHRISEYWLVDPEAETLEQYLLEGDAYHLHIKAQDGNVHCHAIEGLRFPVRACFDNAENLKAMKGLMD